MKTNARGSLTVMKEAAASLAIMMSAFSAQADASLAVGSTPGYPGRTVSVPVFAREATNVVAAQFDVAYSTSRIVPGPGLPTSPQAGHVIRSREIAPGVRRIIVYSLNNALLQTNGFTTTIPFTVSAGERVGSGPIVPSQAILADRNGASIQPVALSSGTIFVTPVNVNPNGTAQFFLASVPDERYLIQATTDFFQWVNISTNVAIGDFMDLLDLDAPNYPYRFYRSVLFDAFFGAFESYTVLQGGDMRLEVTGVPDRVYTLQASTDLVYWEDLTNLTVSAGAEIITVPVEPAYPKRFFRLKSEPYQGASSNFEGFEVLSDGGIRFQVTGLPGRTYTLQATTNLLDWENLQNLTITVGTETFTNAIDPNYPVRFFRLMSDP